MNPECYCNGHEPCYSCHKEQPQPESQTQRIYRLLGQLQDELTLFVPNNCNAAFAGAIMATRQAIKALRVFF